MRKTGKRIAVWLLLLVLTAALAVPAFAAGKIRPEEDVKLTISYIDGDRPISGAVFHIFCVAEVDEYGRMTLTEKFQPYQSSVTGLQTLEEMEDQEGWQQLAETLKSCVQDGLLEDETGVIDDDGHLTVTLKPGLYLVTSSRLKKGDYSYSTVPFMIFLPGMNNEANAWEYEVTADIAAAPKFTKEYMPPKEKTTTRKVLKIWDDEGYESVRPREVVVRLLRDGETYDEQTLNSGNNWRYTWENLEADHEWDIVEKAIPGYTLSKETNGITFTLTNQYSEDEENLVIQKRITGDTPKTNSVFTFVLMGANTSCPMPEGSKGTLKEITITGAGRGDFGEIVFEEPGTYTYTIREKDAGVQGYTYDTTVYTVTYEVVEEDGALHVTRKIQDQRGGKATALVFTNRYKLPGNKLPQTGVLWWPVPVLVFFGLAFVMIGLLKRRRNQG